MNLRTIIPFRETVLPAAPRGFSGLQREIDRLFEEFSSSFNFDTPSTVMPKIDARETDMQIELTAELPGLEAKDVEVSVSGNVLTLKGEKKSETRRQEGQTFHSERSFGSFYRRVELPAGIEKDKISASLENGLLRVVAPKVPAEKARRIDVKGAA